ncbi:YkgJ family cysteine cluster protein [Pseudomonadota bacterium]
MSGSAKEKTGSRLCQSCGLCCTGVVSNVTLVSCSQDRDFIAEISAKALIDQGGDQLFIKQPCPVFDGQCSKYSVRPVDCRTFECKVLKEYRLGAKNFAQSREMIFTMLQCQKKLHTQFLKLHPERANVTESAVYSIVSEICSDSEISPAQEQQLRRDYPDYFFMLYFKNRYFFD